MTEQLSDRFKFDRLKQKIEVILNGLGIRIFLHLILAFGVATTIIIWIIFHYYRSLPGLLAAVVIFGGFLWLGYQIVSVVASLGRRRGSQALFFSGKEWRYSVTQEMRNKLGTNTTGLKIIEEKTKVGQPQFANQTGGIIKSSVVVEEGHR